MGRSGSANCHSSHAVCAARGTNNVAMTTTSASIRNIWRGFSIPINRLNRAIVGCLGILGMSMLAMMFYQQILPTQRSSSRATENPSYQERALRKGNEEDITKEKGIIKVSQRTKEDDRLTDHQMIDILCNMYRREVITGSLCGQICNLKTICATGKKDIGVASGKRVYVLDCTSCLPDHGITSVVMKLFWEPRWENATNTEIAKHKTLESYEEHLNNKLDDYTAMYYGSVLTSAEKTLSVVWGEPLKRKASTNDRIAVLRSISGLISQHSNEEYLSLRFFQKKTFIPHLYGTCGPAYFMEYAPSLDILGYVTGRFKTRAARFEISLKLLQLTKDMDNVNGQGLIMCDVQRGHFGLAKDNRVVITDLDDLMYESAFGSLFLLRHPLERKCSSKYDCHELKCHRDCNFQTKRCELMWANNNLQRICSAIFAKSKDFLNIIQQDGPPSAPPLSAILRECTELSYSNKEELSIKSAKVYEQLNDTLTKLMLS